MSPTGRYNVVFSPHCLDLFFDVEVITVSQTSASTKNPEPRLDCSRNMWPRPPVSSEQDPWSPNAMHVYVPAGDRRTYRMPEVCLHPSQARLQSGKGKRTVALSGGECKPPRPLLGVVRRLTGRAGTRTAGLTPASRWNLGPTRSDSDGTELRNPFANAPGRHQQN